MTTTVLSLPIFRAFDTSGLPLAAGLLYTYAAGTTTPLATYSSSDTSTPNANPVVLDSSGTAVVRTTSAAYKFVLKDATGTNTLWSVDNWQGNYLSAADIAALLWPQTTAEIAAGVTPTNYGYAPGVIDRYGTNTTPGTTDMSTALTNAIASNSVITALASTYNFASTSGFVLKGKRINGAGRNATILQFPNTAASTNALSFQSTSTGYDTTAPGISGCQVLGNGNTNAGANGIALISSDGGGCHGGYFSDVIVGGFKGTGSSGWLLSGSISNGIYDNVFINCFGGPTTTNASWVNTIAWTLTTTDAPAQPNRCNNNNWFGGGAIFSTSDGVKINYASENTFVGFDREQNGGWGFNIQGICPDVTVIGGDSESNTSGSFNKANSSSSIKVIGGNVVEAPNGSNWNSFDLWVPGGTQAGKFGTDPSGNVTAQGTAHNFTGTSPAFQNSGANFFGMDSTSGLNLDYRARRRNGTTKSSSAGALSFAGVNVGYVEVTLTENVTSITMPTATDGFEFDVVFTNGAGPYTVTGWPAAVLLAGGAFTVTATNGKRDRIGFRYHADYSKWIETGRAQNL